jgi:hypothetical protein
MAAPSSGWLARRLRATLHLHRYREVKPLNEDRSVHSKLK